MISAEFVPTRGSQIGKPSVFMSGSGLNSTGFGHFLSVRTQVSIQIIRGNQQQNREIKIRLFAFYYTKSTCEVVLLFKEFTQFSN